MMGGITQFVPLSHPPSSKAEAGFNIVEDCEIFAIREDNCEEEPFINLIDERLFTNDETMTDDDEIPDKPNNKEFSNAKSEETAVYKTKYLED